MKGFSPKGDKESKNSIPPNCGSSIMRNKMLCPYCQKIYTQVTVITYNIDNVETGRITSEYYKNQECQKEKCGAWHRGRCRYNERRN